MNQVTNIITNPINMVDFNSHKSFVENKYFYLISEQEIQNLLERELVEIKELMEYISQNE